MMPVDCRVLLRPRVLLLIFMSLTQLSREARCSVCPAPCTSINTETVGSTDSWCARGPACKCVGAVFQQLRLPNRTACLHLVETSGLETLTPDLFIQFTHLHKLTLDGCRVRTIAPNSFNGLFQLRRLAIFNSEISILPTGGDAMNALCC